ncbi:MAG: hypothetical protein JST30_09980 [Armatimonadetes bacterium]|nr:hypothetical protein [Armatimonadota bacterium]
MPLYLGLDCGGSTTRALILDEQGRTVFEGRGGPANIATTPVDTVVASLSAALDGAPGADLAVGCFAGLVSEREGGLAREALRAAGVAARSDVHPDTWAALAACEDGTDVVVIAGTGSVIASWDGKGGVRKSGGGGPLYGDLGSAFDVVRRAVRCVFIDGRLSASARFEEAVARTLGTVVPQEVVSVVNDVRTTAATVAGLAPVVGEDASVSEAYAVWAVRSALTDLADGVRAHTLGKGGRIALTGGLWDAHPVFPSVFLEALAEGNEIVPAPRPIGQYHVERLVRPPVYGAVRLARRLSYGH